MAAPVPLKVTPPETLRSALMVRAPDMVSPALATLLLAAAWAAA